MTAYITIADHPLRAEQREQYELPAGTQLAQWLTRVSGIPAEVLSEQPPIVIILNGKALDDWHYRLQSGDQLLILPRQYGFLVGGWLMAAITVAGVVASYLLMPDIPETSANTGQDQSPSYSADAQGNRARLGKPIPVSYGDVRLWPDFAAQPYHRYIDQQQHLYQLFSLGQGEHAYSDIKVGDTPLENFSDVEWATFAPGEPVTLFEPAVIESEEVRDIELYAPDQDQWESQPISPAYFANPEGTDVSKIELDFTLPAGLYWMSNGGPRELGVDIHIWIQRYDQDNNLVEPFEPVAWRAEHFTATSLDAQRFTVTIADIPASRVEVKVERASISPVGQGTQPSHRFKDAIHWTGLRGFLNEAPAFEHPVLALKMRVDDQLSRQSERKINLRAQRKLLSWQPQVGWNEPQVTRNPAWAFCDAIMSHWGGRFTDAQLNLPQIAAVAQQFDDEGVYFDGIFDTPGKLWSVLQQLCSVDNAKPILSGGLFSIRRDIEEQPEYSYGMADIVANSFNIEYVTYDEWGYDSIEIEYTDRTSWKPATVLCSVTGQTERPHRVKLRGCTEQEQARKVGHRIAAAREFRNRRVSWKTELSGRLPQYGDTVWVSHEYPQWGISGTVLEVDSDGRTLILSEPVRSEGGWLAIPDASGKLQGPWQVAGSDDEYTVRLPADHNASIRTPATHASQFASNFLFADDAESLGLPVKIRTVRAAGEYSMELTGEYDNPAVYNPDLLPAPIPPKPPGSNSLDITGLQIRHQGTLADPVLLVSWNPLRNTSQYRVEYAYGEADWQFAGRASRPSILLDVRPQAMQVRVAAVMLDGLGPWTVMHTVPGEQLDNPPVIQGLRLATPFDGPVAEFVWEPLIGCDYSVHVVDGDGRIYHQQALTEPQFSYSADTARSEGCGREFTLQVWGRAAGVYSVAPASLAVRNEPPAAVTIEDVMGLGGMLSVFFAPSTAPDLAGYFAYYAVAEFDQADKVTLASPRIEGKTTNIAIPIAADDERPYQVRIAAYDVWGTEELILSEASAGLEAKILNSQLAKELREPIGLIPDLYSNAGEHNLRIGLVESQQSVHTSDIAATAQSIKTVQSKFDGKIATIEQTQQTEAGKLNAQAQRVTNLQTNYDGQLSTLHKGQEAWSDDKETFTQQIETVQSSANNAQATANGAHTLAASVQTKQSTYADRFGKLESMWTVKAQAGNSYASIGLSAKAGSPSQMILAADEFAISNGHVSKAPFRVKNGIVRMDEALIGHAAITTLHLQGNAVTIPSGSTRFQEILLTNSLVTTHHTYISIPEDNMPVLISASLRHGTKAHAPGDTWAVYQVQLFVGPHVIYDSGECRGDHFSTMVKIALGKGTYKVHMRVRTVDSRGVGVINAQTLTALGLRR